jgi:hypothetical protein
VKSREKLRSMLYSKLKEAEKQGYKLCDRDKKLLEVCEKEEVKT